MTKEKILNELMDIQKLAWKNDDLMSQETLFDLQERLADLVLAVAQSCGDAALMKIVKAFPYLYSVK